MTKERSSRQILKERLGLQLESGQQLSFHMQQTQIFLVLLPNGSYVPCHTVVSFDKVTKHCSRSGVTHTPSSSHRCYVECLNTQILSSVFLKGRGRRKSKGNRKKSTEGVFNLMQVHSVKSLFSTYDCELLLETSSHSPALEVFGMVSTSFVIHLNRVLRCEAFLPKFHRHSGRHKEFPNCHISKSSCNSKGSLFFPEIQCIIYCVKIYTACIIS